MTGSSIPRLASAPYGKAAAGDDEAELARLAAETRRLNAEADLLMAVDRKRRAEEMLHGRRWVIADFLTGALLAGGVIGLTAVVVRLLL